MTKRKMSTCGQRLNAARQVVLQLDDPEDIAKEQNFNAAEVSKWAKAFKEHGYNHPLFGWGEERYANKAKVRGTSESTIAVSTEPNEPRYTEVYDRSMEDILIHMEDLHKQMGNAIEEAQLWFENARKFVR